MSNLRFSQVLLKISGEALAGGRPFGIDNQTITDFARDIVDASEAGARISLVIGGGNIFRGVSEQAAGMDRASADYMGMLATVLNALAVQEGLEKQGLSTRVMSAITMREVCEPYIRRRALHHLEKGRVVICAAGTGNPYFTTDTAAALRGAEIGAEIVLKATKVDGIYSADPKKDPHATRYDRISFNEAMQKNLAVMDATAFALCRDQKLPVNVFSIFKTGALKRVVLGEPEGTLVYC